jgi:hypothetical protein
MCEPLLFLEQTVYVCNCRLPHCFMPLQGHCAGQTLQCWSPLVNDDTFSWPLFIVCTYGHCTNGHCSALLVTAGHCILLRVVSRSHCLHGAACTWPFHAAWHARCAHPLNICNTMCNTALSFLASIECVRTLCEFFGSCGSLCGEHGRLQGEPQLW